MDAADTTVFCFLPRNVLGIEMVNATSAGFCSQFIESVRGTSTWHVQDRGIDGAQNQKTIWRSILLPKEKPKKLGTGMIIFLHSSFSHPHLHHPVTERNINEHLTRWSWGLKYMDKNKKLNWQSSYYALRWYKSKNRKHHHIVFI